MNGVSWLSSNPTIKQLSDELTRQMTMRHAHETLTEEDMKALGELQSNLIAVLPKPWWLENYTKR